MPWCPWCQFMAESGSPATSVKQSQGESSAKNHRQGIRLPLGTRQRHTWMAYAESVWRAPATGTLPQVQHSKRRQAMEFDLHERVVDDGEDLEDAEIQYRERLMEMFADYA